MNIDKLLETEGKTAADVKMNLNKLYRLSFDELASAKKKAISVGGAIVGIGLLITAIAAGLSGNSGGMQELLTSIMAINGVAITMTVSKLSELRRKEKVILECQKLLNEGKVDPFKLMQDIRNA